MVLKGRTPTKAEKEWMDSIIDLGCIVCLHIHGVGSPAEVHHINGKTKAGCHFETIGLCYRHHRQGADISEYTSRHPYKYKFVERYGTEDQLLTLTKEYINKNVSSNA